MTTSNALASLYDFRHAFHQCLGHRADARFELTDALLTAGPIPSSAHLCLQTPHRRGWGSR
jgi:hypothetical protein